MRAVVALALVVGTTFADDIETARLRSLVTFFWPTTPSGINSSAQTAETFAASLDDATCQWRDINYNSTSRANWVTDSHLSRVQAMTVGLTVPGSPVFESNSLSNKTHCALQTWFKFNWQNSNWWYQWIGVPLQVRVTIVSSEPS